MEELELVMLKLNWVKNHYLKLMIPHQVLYAQKFQTYLKAMKLIKLPQKMEQNALILENIS